MENKIFKIYVTAEGNGNPNEVIIKIDRDKIFKQELKKFLDKWPNDTDAGKTLRTIAND